MDTVGAPGSWSELSATRRIAVTVVLAAVAVLAVLLANRPSDDPSPTRERMEVIASAGVTEVTPDALRQATRIIAERAAVMGLSMVTAEARGGGLVISLPPDVDPVFREALTATGRLRVYPAARIDRGTAGAAPRVTDPRDALLDDRERPGMMVAARGAPLLTGGDLDIQPPDAGDGSRTIAVMLPRNPRIARLLVRTPMAVALDDALIASRAQFDRSVEGPGSPAMRLEATGMGDIPFLALRAQLVHGPLPVTLTPRS